MYAPTYQEVASHLVQTGSAFDTSCKAESHNSLNSPLCITLVETLRALTLRALLKVDSSSVLPRFEVTSDTYSIEPILDERIPDDMLEYDVVVRMPPKREYSVVIKVVSREKAVSRIVEPDYLDLLLGD